MRFRAITSLCLLALFSCQKGKFSSARVQSLVNEPESATGVGNGGETLVQYLEAVRTALVETLESFQRSIVPSDFCTVQRRDRIGFLGNALKLLNPAQVEFCRDFLVHTAGPMIALNRNKDPISITLSREMNSVPNSSGDLRPVTARTGLGPQGPIWFNYDRIRQISPSEVFFLFVHELGHKVSYPSMGNFVSDELVLPPFSTPRGGERLLNAAASALTLYARDLGKIGDSFGFQDYFRCEVIEERTGFRLSSSGASSREFLSEDLARYETGIGKGPRDFACEVSEEPGATSLFARLIVHEPNGCRTTTALDLSRWSRIEVWERSNLAKDNGKRLETKVFPGHNPLCLGERSDPFEISLKRGSLQFKFRLRYQFSSAVLSD